MFDLINKHSTSLQTNKYNKHRAKGFAPKQPKPIIITNGIENVSMEEYNRNKKRLTRYSKRMRHRPTKPESLIYNTLCRLFPDLKIERQTIVIIEKKGYILDIYIPSRKLCFEVDGDNHLWQKEYDLIRDEKVLKLLGIKTLRIKNKDVNNIEGVIEFLKQTTLQNKSLAGTCDSSREYLTT